MIDPEEANDYPKPGGLIDDKYRIVRMLGAGGMGAVLEATHILRQAPVALKFMSPRLINDPAIVERFLNEGVAASRINNEHVVSVLDVSKLSSGQPYLVMEYLEGRDLAKVLASEGAPGLADVQRCVHFVLQILRGLQVAHAAGIIHRDLKPANCLVVERDEDPDFLKIVDFGISKVNAAPLHLTQVGSALGTPYYVSPEQARDAASVDVRSDLYSVSVILYELLCGRTPFHPASGQLSELFMLLATSKPECLDEFRSDLPDGLDAAVQVGLAKTPSGRFSSTADMAAALAPFSDGRSDRVLKQLLQRPTSPRGLRFNPSEAALGTRPTPAEVRPSETVLEKVQTPAPAGFRTLPQPTQTALSTMPSFFRRRQMELLMGIPILVAIGLAVLYGLDRREPRPSSDGVERPPEVQRIDLVPRASREEAGQGGGPVSAPPSNRGRDDPARANGVGVGVAPIVSAEPDRREFDPPPSRPARGGSAGAGSNDKGVGSPSNPSPPQRTTTRNPRRPTLRQIGIEE